MKKVLTLLCIAAALVAFAPAQAKADTIAVALLIDASGSISDSDYALQRNAYVSALGAYVPTDSSVAVGVWQFGEYVQQIFAPTLITSGADRTSLVNAVNGMTRDLAIQYSTAIGDAINTAAPALLGLGAFDTYLIDVSTDGFNNWGADVDTAADNAILAGIDRVNCLGIGAGADCGFFAGAGSFYVTAVSFATFQSTLENKLAQELGAIPEPASMLLLGTGLLGLGRAWRKRRG